VINRNDGIIDEYIDVESDFDPYTIGEEDLVKMDCITCHNRISHLIPQPEDAVDSAISRGLIEQEIPGIRAKSIELLRADYASKEEGLSSIAQLTNYYQEEYPDFYDQSSEAVFRAADVLRDIYDSSIYPEQKVDWDTHPDNLGHQSDPGCFRCHDGQHMNSADFAIRVECNLCHDIPLVSGPENEAVLLQLVKEEMPNTHFMPNWIILHDIVYEGNGDVETCSACHDTSAIGAENTTFCSNSACHGGGNDLIDFETLMEMGRGINMLKNLPHYPMNLPVVSEWDNSLDQLHRDQEGVLCEDCHDTMPPVGQPPEENCIACHGETAQGLFDLTAQFEPNPHDGHEGAGACSLCHPNFGPEIEPCALCHENIPYSLISESE